MKFSKVTTQGKGAKVASQIARRIEEGAFSEGDKLPPERTIADQMNVSRHAVREALSALQIVGMVQSRQGDGTYVRNVATNSSVERAREILDEADDSLEVLDARWIIERSIAELVYDRFDDDDLAELSSLVNDMRHGVENDDLDQFLEADQRFHLKFAELTGNDVICRTVSTLVGAMQNRLWKELKRQYVFQQDPHTAVDIHQEIVDAVEAGDPEALQAAVKDHYESMEPYL